MGFSLTVVNLYSGSGAPGLCGCALERQMLDKLKERQKRNYQHEEMQKEQHFNDEIATIRFKAQAV